MGRSSSTGRPYTYRPVPGIIQTGTASLFASSASRRRPEMQRFQRYIGIDYSGAQTPAKEVA